MYSILVAFFFAEITKSFVIKIQIIMFGSQLALIFYIKFKSAEYTIDYS